MHNIFMESYPIDVNKSEVQDFWDEKARYDDYQEGCSGLPGSIQWKDRTFNNLEEAQNWINDNDYAYWQVAVRYKAKVLKHSAAYKKALKQRDEARIKLNDISEKIHYSSKNVKSAFVACKKCQSKLATKYLLSNQCPVCGKDLRPDSLLKKISELSSKCDKLNRLVRDENYKDIDANKKTDGLKWLVKVEYHT